MTYEDAIKYLDLIAAGQVGASGEETQKAYEALETAKRVLKKQNADGCERCKYQSKDEFEMPCLMCKRSKMDYWRSDEQ